MDVEKEVVLRVETSAICFSLASAHPFNLIK
jgi:hypothetical protein